MISTVIFFFFLTKSNVVGSGSDWCRYQTKIGGVRAGLWWWDSSAKTWAVEGEDGREERWRWMGICTHGWKWCRWHNGSWVPALTGNKDRAVSSRGAQHSDWPASSSSCSQFHFSPLLPSKSPPVSALLLDTCHGCSPCPWASVSHALCLCFPFSSPVHLLLCVA